VRAKIWEKNRRKEVQKTFFLYKHEYRDQEMSGGKTRETIFPETHE